MENGIEKKIIEEMCLRLVATRDEIHDFISKEVKVPMTLVKSVTRSMVQKGFLREIHTSNTSFAITKKGMRSFK